MKKLVLFAVAVVAISFASCSNKANTEAPANGDSTAVVAPQEIAPVATDSLSADSTVVAN